MTTGQVFRVLLRGLRGQCPVCKHSIFESFLKEHDECPRCGWVFQEDPGDFAGSVTLVYFLVTPLVIAGYIIWQDFFKVPFMPALVVFLILVALVEIPLLRLAKGLWFALLYISTHRKMFAVPPADQSDPDEEAGSSDQAPGERQADCGTNNRD